MLVHSVHDSGLGQRSQGLMRPRLVVAGGAINARCVPGADRMSSFGDWIALSDTCDEATAKIISREVSDGIVAPDYEPAALALLAAKKGGKYTVLRMDPTYEPPALESRQVYGITMQQLRNNRTIDASLLANVVTQHKEVRAALGPGGVTKHTHSHGPEERRAFASATVRAAARGRQARPSRGHHRAQVHAVQLGLLCEERPGKPNTAPHGCGDEGGGGAECVAHSAWMPGRSRSSCWGSGTG